MDFFDIKQRSVKNGVIEIYPEFRIGRIQDIMARGKGFYAIYDKENDIWSKDECLVQDLIDKAVQEKYEEVAAKSNDKVVPKYMRDFSTKIWTQYRLFISTMPDNFHQLDSKLTFKSDPVTRKSYISKKLPYDLAEGPCKSFDKLMSVLYDEEERTKIEWMIGSIVSGDSREIQKFFVFYGGPGTGKSTVLNIIQQLFEGYFIVFDAKALATASNQFSMEMFREDPLVAIQHDGDLSRIDDNTKINSIVSHELMTVNEKFKAPYTARANCVLIMATNKPVKITDSNSGIMRRLIDIHPTGKKIKSSEYEVLMERIPFELGEIANRCLKVYRELGKNYYKNYIPMDMVQKTDVFFNFIDENYETFLSQDNMSLKQAYDMYKTYCDESALEFVMPKYKFKEELKNYYEEFEKRKKVNGMEYKNIYSGFKVQKLQQGDFEKKETPCSLVLDKTKSILDDILKDEPAQYGNDQESPTKKWSDVDTTLKDIDTKKLHYVRVPLNHIVIDFDLKNDAGEKSAAMNLEAASKWPPTYAEFSKGGNGVHLHYIYDGDPTKLKNVYSDGIEIKVFNGKSSLRRRLSKCNDIPIATISKFSIGWRPFTCSF